MKTFPRAFRVLFPVLLLAAGVNACTSSRANNDDPTPTAVVHEVNLYNWETYIDPSVLTSFEQRYGIKVNYFTFNSNDELLSVLESDPQNLARYDVIVPSNFSVATLRQDKRLALLDKKEIPNLIHIDPLFVNPSYDPGNRYCVPYQWGTMGIGYNPKTTPKEIRSWADFFREDTNQRIAMLDDMRLSMGAVLLALGYSPNTSNVAEITAARDFLLARAGRISTYHADNGQDLLLEGQVDAVYEWSGDIFQVIEKNPDLRYVIPAEGSIIWNDSVCILEKAPHKKDATTLLNYFLDPKVGATISNYTHYASPNMAALPQINEADRKNPAIYPSAEVQNRLFFLAELDEQTLALYQAAWEEVLKTANR